MKRKNEINSPSIEDLTEIFQPEKILRQIGISGRLTIAEIECGNGIFSLSAVDLLSDDGKIYCFDSNETDIHILKTKITKINIVPILCKDIPGR